MALNKPLFLAIALSVLLPGCSVMGSRESPLKEATAGSPTLVDVYRGKFKPDQASTAARDTARERLERSSIARPIARGDEQTKRYWSALEPMQQRFARVPNPDLVMVVYPHLAKGRYPVPGYVTVFPMYETTEYAMPGEVAEELKAGRAAFSPAGIGREARQ